MLSLTKTSSHKISISLDDLTLFSRSSLAWPRIPARFPWDCLRDTARSWSRGSSSRISRTNRRPRGSPPSASSRILSAPSSPDSAPNSSAADPQLSWRRYRTSPAGYWLRYRRTCRCCMPVDSLAASAAAWPTGSISTSARYMRVQMLGNASSIAMTKRLHNCDTFRY